MKKLMLIISFFAVSLFAADSTLLKELEAKADSGDVEAQIDLAFKYRYGDGVENDIVKAYDLARPFAGQGHLRAQYLIGTLCPQPDVIELPDLHGVLYKRIIDSLELSGTVPDSVRARVRSEVWRELDSGRWFLKAAEQGLADAQCALGFNYLFGIAPDRDMNKATYWFEKAAQQGHAWSQFTLGTIYCDGYPIKTQQHDKAYLWISLAEESDDERVVDNAKGYMARLMEIISEEDLQKGRELLRQWRAEHPKK